jgi:hypothetical protein
MALTELIFGTTKASIGLVELDASIRESHSANATVTRHPVEADVTGQTAISDNVHVDPLSIQIEGVVTNTPTDWLAGALSSTETDADVQAHLELLGTLQLGELITVRTTLYEYENMVLESLQVTRDAASGNALHLTATATQVQLVELQETDIGAGQRPVTKSTRRGGRRPAQAANTDTTATSQSTLSKLKDAVSRLIP